LPKEIFAKQPTLALSLLGVTGLTAYLGLVEKGHLTARSGQTVVVSAAAGSTGSFAGQVKKKKLFSFSLSLSLSLS
jgi:NADPH-dependent curcumin reductase CurA